MAYKECEVCKKEYRVKPCLLERSKCCSKSCANLQMKKYTPPWELGQKIKKENPKGKFIECNFCKKSIYKYPRDIKRCSYLFCNRQCKIKWSKTSLNPLWKGDSYPENKRLRQSAKYKNWRKKILLKDNYTCQICGLRGGRLTADHIKSWCMFPENRFDIDNGRTLCFTCHTKTDTWGLKAKFQFRKHGVPKPPVL